MIDPAAMDRELEMPPINVRNWLQSGQVAITTKRGGLLEKWGELAVKDDVSNHASSAIAVCVSF